MGGFKILQNSQENTCVGVSFWKNFIEKETQTQGFSCELGDIFNYIFFIKHATC